jgi:hypothetical protein
LVRQLSLRGGGGSGGGVLLRVRGRGEDTKLFSCPLVYCQGVLIILLLRSEVWSGLLLSGCLARDGVQSELPYLSMGWLSHPSLIFVGKAGSQSLLGNCDEFCFTFECKV